jgi:hypothetical protein
MTRGVRARIAVVSVAACVAVTPGCSSADEYGCGECGPTHVVVGDGDVWAAQGRTVWRLDATGGDPQARVSVLPERRSGDVQAITLNGADAWIGWSSTVARVRPSGDLLRHPRRPRGFVSGMVTVRGRTWLAAERWVFALAGDGSVRRRLLLPTRVAGLTGGDRVVWAVGRDYAIALDAQTGRRVRTLQASAAAVAVWRRSLWIATVSGLEQIDATTGRSLRRVSIPQVRFIAVGGDALWALTFGGTLLRLDPDTGERVGAHLSLERSVGSLTTGAGSVWVGGGGQDPEVVKVDPETMRVSWVRAIPPT